jgi:hypothetical protein
MVMQNPAYIDVTSAGAEELGDAVHVEDGAEDDEGAHKGPGGGV